MTDVLAARRRPPSRTTSAASGARAASGETYEKHNPWRPSETIGEFPPRTRGRRRGGRGRRGRVPGLVPAARWRARAAFFCKAADALERRVEQIAQDMTLEMGKPLREARGEAGRTPQILRFFAGEAFRAVGERYEQAATGSVVYTLRRPLGVVGLITPWNFPAAIPVWKSAPALDLRQHRRDEAGVRGAAHRPPPRRVLRGGRPAGRRASTSLVGRGLGGRRRARRAPAGARDLVHRLGRGRPVGARARRRRSASASSSSSAATTR